MTVGNKIYDLRKKIQQIKSELDDDSFDISPEIIDSTNLLRSNEHLEEKTQKQDELINTYDEYSKELEQLINTLFEIQSSLRDVLKQSISMSKSHK